MYRSHFSVSRSKRQKAQQDTWTTIDVLHNGLRRKVSETDYKSIYPRMKIGNRSQVNTISILKNEYNEEHLYEEVQKMKEENRKVATENDQLRTSIRRENKINELFNKRREDCPLQSMGLQKVMELKLILQFQQLEQQYTECENKLKQVVQTHKSDKMSMGSTTIQSHIDLYCVLQELGKNMSEERAFKEQLLNKRTLDLHKLKANTRKLKQICKGKQEELLSLEETIQKEKKILPMKYDLNLNVSDSGLMGRNKPMQETEVQIQRTKNDQKRLQAQIQNQMDVFIRQKLLIYKQIEDIKEQRQLRSHQKEKNIINW